jgi:hypothetical protein
MISFVAELVALKMRVAELERFFFASARSPRRSLPSEPEARFRAGKRLWNQEDDALLRARYPHESTQAIAVALRRSISSVYGRATQLGLAKTDEYLASPAACRLRRGDAVGARFRFTKGHVPANKGLRRPGYAPGRMSETQFKMGESLNRMPIGSTRLVYGYLYRKIADTPYVTWTKNWIIEHQRLWEAANGPVPPGHALAFKNGDRTDVRLDNLECITRRELMARNTVHNLPKELVKTIQLLGVLNRQINRRTRDEKRN